MVQNEPCHVVEKRIREYELEIRQYELREKLHEIHYGEEDFTP